MLKLKTKEIVGLTLLLIGLISLIAYPFLVLEKPVEAVAATTITEDEITISLSKTTVKVNEGYEVTVTVRNPSEFWYIKGIVEVWYISPQGIIIEYAQDVVLEPLELKTYSYSTFKGCPGTYPYKASLLAWGCLEPVAISYAIPLTVIEVKHIYLTFSATDHHVKAGEEFSLIAEVINMEPVTISGTLEIIKNNAIVQSYLVLLDPEERAKYVYTLTESKGTHTYAARLKVDDFEAREKVMVYVYDLGALTSTSLSASKTEVKLGETVDITAIATNHHNEPVSGILYILRDGSIVHSTPVIIPAKESVKTVYTTSSSFATSYTYKSKLVVGPYTRESSEVKVKFYPVEGEVKLTLACIPSVRPNEMYKVEVKIFNNRNIPLSGKLVIMANNHVEKAVDVSLKAREETTVKYTTFKEMEGVYVYLAKITTPEVHFVSNAQPLKVEELAARKFIESAGFIGSLPALPLLFIGSGAIVGWGDRAIAVVRKLGR